LTTALFVVLMMCAEAGMIAAEVQAAKSTWLNPTALGIQAVTALSLLALYDWGTKHMGDIWVVSVASVASVVIAEPLIVFAMTREVPGKQQALGMVLALIAIIVSSSGSK
jgi:hypothetical protein